MEEMTGVFRSAAFGGFNKEDVLKFIEMQKKTEAELRKSVESLNAVVKDLSEKLENETAEKNTANARLSDNKEAKEALSALAVKSAEYKALENKFNALIEEKIAVSEREALLAEKTEELTREIERIKGEKAVVPPQEDSKSVESQVGSAIVDARRFADQIVAEAKKTAEEINEKTLNTMDEIVKQALVLDSRFKFCEQKCNDFFRETAEEITAMTDEILNLKSGLLNNMNSAE